MRVCILRLVFNKERNIIPMSPSVAYLAVLLTGNGERVVDRFAKMHLSVLAFNRNFETLYQKMRHRPCLSVAIPGSGSASTFKTL